jgi:hypothetical protein
MGLQEGIDFGRKGVRAMPIKITDPIVIGCQITQQY